MNHQTNKVMATRSRIAIQKSGEDKVSSIYCHYDGYPDGVGSQLLTYYNTEESISKLIAGGNLSQLGSPDFVFTEKESYEKDFRKTKELAIGKRFTIRYSSSNDNALIHDSLESFLNALNSFGTDYIYLFKDGKWEISSYPKRISTNGIIDHHWTFQPFQ